MFSCKVCAEKDKRILSLENEISFLRTLVHPVINNAELPDNTLEADGVISGHDHVIEIQSRADALAEEDVLALEERNKILSGEY